MSVTQDSKLRDWNKYAFGDVFHLSNWRSLIAGSDLPEEIKKIVYTTVHCTRLWPHEKFDVAQELLDHFIDALLAGKSSQALITDFGDPQTTAKLIHLSKKRNRPMFVKIAQLFGGFFALITISYLLIWGYFHSAEATVTTDYLPDLNALTMNVAKEDRAWPIYREAIIKYDRGEFGESSWEYFWEEFWAEDTDPRVGQRLIKPGDENWPKVAERLEEMNGYFELIRLASQKPKFGLSTQSNVANYSPTDLAAIFPGQDLATLQSSTVEQFDTTPEVKENLSGSIISTWIAGTNRLRTMADLLVIDTRYAMQQGDSDRALTNVKAILGMASHPSDTNFIAGGVLSVRISKQGLNLIEEILTGNGDFFSELQLADLQNTLESIQVFDWLQLGGDKSALYDLVQRFYTDNGNGDGRITPLGVQLANKNPFVMVAALSSSPAIGTNATQKPREPWIDYDQLYERANRVFTPVSSLFMASRKETTAMIDEIFAKAEQQKTLPPWSPERISFDDWYDEMIDNKKFSFIANFISLSDPIFRVFDEMKARKDAVVVAIACQRYKMQNEQWPENLESLVPDLLSVVPNDPVTGEQLLMTQEFGMPLIYSVGYDLKDDSGRQAVEDVSDFDDRPVAPHSMFGGRHGLDEISSDWILWPQLNWLDRVPKESATDNL